MRFIVKVFAALGFVVVWLIIAAIFVTQLFPSQRSAKIAKTRYLTNRVLDIASFR